MKKFVLCSTVVAVLIALTGQSHVYAGAGTTYFILQQSSGDSQKVDVVSYGVTGSATSMRTLYQNSDLQSGQKIFKYLLPEVDGPVVVKASWVDNKTGQLHQCSASEDDPYALFDIAATLLNGKCSVKMN